VIIDDVTLRFAFFTPYHQNIAQKFHDGEFEKTALLAWKEHAKTSAIIYDIGGYNGIFGLLAAKMNPNSTVVIFLKSDEFFVVFLRSCPSGDGRLPTAR